jgi:hypothetical protein
MSLIPQPRLPHYREPEWGPVLNAYVETLEARVRLLEAQTASTVGPPGPPGTGIEVYPQYSGLQMVFGPGPLPNPATLPNTVYVVLPDLD